MQLHGSFELYESCNCLCLWHILSWLYPSHCIPSQVTGVLLVRLWLQLYRVLPVTFVWKVAPLQSPVHQGHIRTEANRLPALFVRQVNNELYFSSVTSRLIIFIRLQWLIEMSIPATQRLHCNTLLHHFSCSTSQCWQCQTETQHFSSLKGTTVMCDWVQPISLHWGLALKDITVLQVQPSPPSTPAPSAPLTPASMHIVKLAAFHVPQDITVLLLDCQSRQVRRKQIFSPFFSTLNMHEPFYLWSSQKVWNKNLHWDCLNILSDTSLALNLLWV